MSPILATIAALSATVVAAITVWLRHRLTRRARDRDRLHCALAQRFPWLHVYTDADHALHHHDQPNRPRTPSLYAATITVLTVLGVLASAHTAANPSTNAPHRLPTIGITDPPTHDVSTTRTARAHRPTTTTTPPSNTTPPRQRPTAVAPSPTPETTTTSPPPSTHSTTNTTTTPQPAPAPAPDVPANTRRPAEPGPDTRSTHSGLRGLIVYSLELLFAMP